MIKPALRFADRAFLEIDGLVDEGIERPTSVLASGSVDSLIDWDSISRRGKDFVVSGPGKEQIAEFVGREAMLPLRVYVGLGCRETAEQRAQLALEELIRVGGFERSVLVVANPTGTGWLQPEAVDTLEYLPILIPAELADALGRSGRLAGFSTGLVRDNLRSLEIASW